MEYQLNTEHLEILSKRVEDKHKKTKRFTLAGFDGLACCEHVYDGDTPHLTLFPGSMDRPYRWTARMARIDAPELRGKNADPQPAKAARDYLKSIIYRRLLWVSIRRMGKYGRPIVEIYTIEIDKKTKTVKLVANVNDLMLMSGHAILYT